MPASLTNQIELIQSSGLFDLDYYLRQAPESADFEHGPIAHYLTTTGEQCYQPHPLFDARFYISSYPDLQDCAASVHPLLHYLQHGASEGRDPHPLFSTNFYLDQCPGLRSAGLNPLVHFINSDEEISPHELFDVSYYKSKVPESVGNPLVYFLQHDNSSFVSPHPIFDSSFYLAQLPHDQRDCANPLMHFLTSDAGKSLSPHPLFNAREYLLMRWDIAAAKLNAFMHFVRHGYKEGYEPNRMFQSSWYLEKHPDLVASGINPLLHYVKHHDAFHPFFDAQYYRHKHNLPEEADAVVHGLASRRTTDRFFDEPLLGSGVCLEKNIPITELDLAFDKLLELTARPFARVFIILGMIPGTPGRMLDTNIGALQKLYGYDDVLVLYSHLTPQDQPPAWLPPNSRAINLHSLHSGNNAMIALLVAAFLTKRKPQAIHILESHLLLYVLGAYPGLIDPRSRTLLYLYGLEIYLNTMGPEYWFYSLDGPSIGCAVKSFDCVVTDSDRLRLEIEHRIKERSEGNKKTVTIRALTPKYTERLLALGANRQLVPDGHILWASRLALEKRPDILAAIAARVPEIQFVVYGSLVPDRVRGEAYLKALLALPNVRYEGPYKDFSELALENVMAFLYTTETDGVPLVLGEAAALGLPLIAPRIGGVPEIVTNTTGWLIEQFDDVEQYIDAIRAVCGNPDEASRRVKAAQALLYHDYSQSALDLALAKLPEFF
jgi:glycosyltransferase involved in cell wall biosynthesis